MGERRKGKEDCEYLHMMGTVGERLRSEDPTLFKAALPLVLRLQTTGCDFKHSLGLNILLLPLFLKEQETCVTSGTAGSSSCSLCV